MESRIDVKARVEEMMAEVRRMAHGIGDVQKKIFQVTATAESEDGLITVTVGPRGHLIDLEIDPRIYRRPDAALLAQTIVETTRRAIEQASEEIANLYNEFVPKDLAAEKMIGGMGLPKDAMRKHDSELLKSRELHDD